MTITRRLALATLNLGPITLDEHIVPPPPPKSKIFITSLTPPPLDLAKNKHVAFADVGADMKDLEEAITSGETSFSAKGNKYKFYAKADDGKLGGQTMHKKLAGTRVLYLHNETTAQYTSLFLKVSALDDHDDGAYMGNPDEVKMHRELNGISGVVPLLASVIEDDYSIAVTPLRNDMTLADIQRKLRHIITSSTDKNKLKLSYISLFNFLIQMSEIIKQVNAKGIIHRDCKPENFLVNIDTRKKISLEVTDFGSAAYASDMVAGKNYEYGTLFTSAPEALAAINDKDRAAKLDVTCLDAWALGVFLGETVGVDFSELYGEEMLPIINSRDYIAGDLYLKISPKDSPDGHDYKYRAEFSSKKADHVTEPVLIAGLKNKMIVNLLKSYLSPYSSENKRSPELMSLSKKTPPKRAKNHYSPPRWSNKGGSDKCANTLSSKKAKTYA